MGIDAAVTELLPGTDLARVSAGRVTLRRFTRADLDARCSWPPYDDPVFSHLDMHLDTAPQRDIWFDRESSARQPFWFAVDDEHGELIGSITLRDVSRWRRSTRLGTHLHPKRLDQHYGAEAMNLFVDYYFRLLGYRLLKLDVAAFNRRAIRCYERVGFRVMYEFWRANTSGVRWLEDERFKHVRDAIERRHGMERVRHFEMHLDAATYRARNKAAP
jgi:RimJ/RimL family protein N-acetyltransferase